MIYYVNARAERDGNGSKQRPFKHIDDAARIAVAGDEVIVARLNIQSSSLFTGLFFISCFSTHYSVPATTLYNYEL